MGKQGELQWVILNPLLLTKEYSLSPSSSGTIHSITPPAAASGGTSVVALSPSRVQGVTHV